MAEMLVEVVEIVERPSGTKGLGNSFMVKVEEAIEGVRADKFKAARHSRGVIPPEWEGAQVVEGQAEAAAVEAKEVDGIQVNGGEQDRADQGSDVGDGGGARSGRSGHARKVHAVE